MKRDNETVTQHAMRMIRNDIIEECAQVAEEAASEAQHDYENKQEGEYLWCVDQSNEIADLIRQRKDED